LSKILGDIRKPRCTTGINDTGVNIATGSKFVAGVNYTSGKFATVGKFATGFVMAQGLGETDSRKKPEIENLVA
jgi:hypothetical protein